jgi:phosphoglycolate phosphatase
MKAMANGNSGRVRAFVFDLDGTLIDSKQDLVTSVNAMLRETKREEQPPEQVASCIGHGAPRLIASVLGPGSSEEQRREALAIFLAHYQQRKLDATRPYPGVAEGLEKLAGNRLAVLSNKPAQLSVDILKGLGLARFFQAIYGGDSFGKKKPDPAGALEILKELGTTPETSAMVGDSDVDVQTARNAGMLAVGVNYGFGQHDRERQPADIYIDNLVELAALAENHRS